MQMRLADYVAETLAQHGIKHVFLVTGGGAMHLNDAFGRAEGIEYFCCHHEQACAMAAESYYRHSGRLAAVNVTSGPGGTNAITGVYGAYTDSLGVIVVSGQVKWETLVRSTDLPLRQLGDQEIDIVSIVSPITKYAVVVNDPKSIRYHLERALHLAVSGRPGPVWLDIPINVQAAPIETDTLEGYDPAENAIAYAANLPDLADLVLSKVAEAKRPVIMAGSGVRIGGAVDLLARLTERWKIPVVTAWNGHDTVPNTNPYFIGRPGSIGDRPGNFAVQNADFVLVLGNRLNVRQVSYAWEAFARDAYLAVVEIDAVEMEKPTIAVDLKIHADVKDFLAILLDKPAPRSDLHAEWLAWCVERRERYPAVLPEYSAPERENVNPYVFVQRLFEILPENESVVCGDGTACVATFQGAFLKPGQRLYTNSGAASMGYDLPAAIGACVSAARKRIICLAGDGSIQMNVQELATIAGQQLPIKIFVLNNRGYHSIRQTQGNYFPDNIVGCGNESRVFMPSMERLAIAYGIPYRICDSHASLEGRIRETIDAEGPQMCEIVLDLEQAFAPKLSSKRLPNGTMVSAPLEDLYPFLDREEFLSNMIIEPLPASLAMRDRE